MTHLAPEPDWTGTFSPLVFTRVLKRACDEGRSGALSVVSGPSVKSVHFSKGTVRFAASNQRRDRLGQSMLAHEFITEKDYELANEKMKSDGCRFGEALLQMGRLTEKELHRELAIQVQRIVLSLFRVREGVYRFDDSEPGGNAALPFGLSVPSLLLKGLRVVTDARLLLSALPPADALVRASNAPAYPIDLKKLAPVEREVLEMAGEGTAIGALVRNASVDRDAALRSCYALLTVGLLETVPQEEAADEASCRDLIEGQFARLEAVSDEAMLGLRQDASSAEIIRAYSELGAEWKEVRAQTEEPSLLEKLDAIEIRLAAAYRRLLVEREHHAAETAAEDAEVAEEEAPAEPEPMAPVDNDAPAPEPEASHEDAAPPPQGQSDPMRAQRIAQLDRDATLHVKVRDWAGAVSLLRELVSLEEKSPRYRAMLAEALSHLPASRTSAEAHYLEALKLTTYEPDEIELRLALGRYYQSLGKQPLALAEFRTVLDLDPGNQEAQRLTAAFKEPKRMGRFFKKIFR